VSRGLTFPAKGQSKARIERLEFLNPSSGQLKKPVTAETLEIRFYGFAPSEIENASFVVSIAGPDGNILFFSSTRPDCDVTFSLQQGNFAFSILFSEFPLTAGSYSIGAGIAVPNVEWIYWEPNAVMFDVDSGPAYHGGIALSLSRNGFYVSHQWRVPQLAQPNKVLAV
jgi:hypothetical protein